MFKVTAKAAEQICAASSQGGTQGMALRFAAQVRQDGSIEYLMGFDEPGEADIHVSSEGVEIVIAPEYVSLLDEATMDYVELTDGDWQFIFLNPKDETYLPPSGD